MIHARGGVDAFVAQHTVSHTKKEVGVLFKKITWETVCCATKASGLRKVASCKNTFFILPHFLYYQHLIYDYLSVLLKDEKGRISTLKSTIE